MVVTLWSCHPGWPSVLSMKRFLLQLSQLRPPLQTSPRLKTRLPDRPETGNGSQPRPQPILERVTVVQQPKCHTKYYPDPCPTPQICLPSQGLPISITIPLIHLPQITHSKCRIPCRLTYLQQTQASRNIGVR